MDLDRHPRADADTLALEVVVEPEEGAWHAWCPTLLDYGAATWGATREEALGHIREVAAMVIGRLAEAGAPVPEAPDAAGAPDGPGWGAAERVVLTFRVPAG